MESLAYTLIFVFGILLVSFFVMMGFVLKSRLASYNTGEKLARTMGLKSASQARRPSLAWFEGEFQGRPFALRIVGKYAGRGIENRRTYISVLRLAMAVNTKTQLGFKAKFGRKDKSIRVYDVNQDITDSDQVFKDSSSSAFWDFVQKGYPAGFEDGDLRFSRGTRELGIGERQSVGGEYDLMDTVLTQVPAIIVHDHIRPNRTADQVQTLLKEMQEVAQALEEEY